VGDVEPRHRVPVRLCLCERPPSECPAPADLVVDDDFLPEEFFQQGRLPARLAVRLPARVEADHVGDLVGGERFFLAPGGTDSRSDAKRDQAQQGDSRDGVHFFHRRPPRIFQIRFQTMFPNFYDSTFPH
jgi:hypothetical protein